LRQWRAVTLPMLAPVNQTMLLVMFLWVFNDFNTPYILFGTAQPPAGDLISFHIYNASFLSWDFGVGSAMSVLLLLFLLLVSLLYLYFTQWRKESAHARDPRREVLPHRRARGPGPVRAPAAVRHDHHEPQTERRRPGRVLL